MSWISKVSTKPHYESYVWGKHRSLFASIIYGMVFCIRVLSPLQWVKLIFRAKFDSSKNDEKERKDFHALHSEIYILCVLAFSLMYYFASFNLVGLEELPAQYKQGLNFLANAVATWLLIESIMWVFYYMLLRILIEKHLTIFNEAEYFIVLPFVLLTQFYLLAGLLSVGMPDILNCVLSLNCKMEGRPTAEVLLGTLGYIYTALIIANIINLIPAIPVSRRPNITLIGAGDVVKSRMLPALLEKGLYRPSQLAIVSDVINDEFKLYLQEKGVTYHEVGGGIAGEAKVQAVVNFIKKRSSYALVATPTESHLTYVSALAKANIIFGVEKPFVGTAAELAILDQCKDQLMENGFLMSYYWLEKALPVNYFLNLNPQYRQFLTIKSPNSQSGKAIGPDTLAYLRLQLGKVTGVKIRFYEGKDERPWGLTKETGGLYFETLIHPITMLINVLDKPIKLDSLKAQWCLLNTLPELVGNGELTLKDFGASYVSISSKPDVPYDIDIKAGKFMQEKKRSLHMVFENGSINMDLDTLHCEIMCPKAGRLSIVEIEVKPEFGGGNIEPSGRLESPLKYAVQMTLFDSFVHNNGRWDAQRYDDFPGQIAILEEMTKWLKSESDNTHFYSPKLLSSKAYQQL